VIKCAYSLNYKLLFTLRDLVNSSAEFLNSYGDLKERLTGTFSKSPKQLIDHADLVDLKPPVLVAKALALLLPGGKLGMLFLTLFMRKLPAECHDLYNMDFTCHKDMVATANLTWGGGRGRTQCSLSRWRPQKVDKRMVLEYTHGLFIT
jgi:hypothetical protein